jgi:hypothetical protein
MNASQMILLLAIASWILLVAIAYGLWILAQWIGALP